MKYLVDANVLSEMTKPAPNPEVLEWLRGNESELVVDPVILGELHLGVLRLDPGRKRDLLENWFQSLVHRLRCVPWDAAVGLRWAKLVDYLRRQGQSMPILDGMIAATALHHGFTVATRNIRDFQKSGVDLIDPFS